MIWFEANRRQLENEAAHAAQALQDCGGCGPDYCHCAAEEEREGAERDAQKQKTVGGPPPTPTVEAAPETTVVNKHTHTPTPLDTYIGRGSAWGNPYTHRQGTKAQFVVGSVEAAVEAYRILLWTKVQDGRVTLNDLAQLHGRTLVCFCSSPDRPRPCHGHVLAAAAAFAVGELDHLYGDAAIGDDYDLNPSAADLAAENAYFSKKGI